MINKNIKNQNSLNIFLNHYFNILILFVIVLILAISYFIVLKPKFNQTLGAIQENIENQQKLYDSQQKKLADLKAISQMYEKISPEELKKFNGVLPDSYIKERLYGELEEIIASSGFAVNSIKIAGEEDEKKASASDAPAPKIDANGSRVGKVIIEVSLSAIDYSGFKNLLKVLENNSRLLDISEIDFSNSENKAFFKITSYYYKPLK